MARRHLIRSALLAAGTALALLAAANASLPTVPRCPDGTPIAPRAKCPPGGPFIIRFEAGGTAVAGESRGPLDNAVELYRSGVAYKIVVEVHRRAADRREARQSRRRGMAVVRELVARGVPRAAIRITRPSGTSFRELAEPHVQLLLYWEK